MILVVNAGSSSVKVVLFDPGLSRIAALSVAEIGGPARLTAGAGPEPVAAPDHTAALGLILVRLAALGHPVGDLTAAAHRVVHGGEDLTAPVLLSPEAIARIGAWVPLAPLHNPANLAGIAALSALAPGLPQTASFDTAFHTTIPPVDTTYALPLAERARGLRRYGFHGLSYAGLVTAIRPLPDRLLAFHLGNGASLCAILRGRSVATSMGFSPLDGLTMGTRSGAIDPMAVLDLAGRHGIERAGRLLNRDSGLRGLAGTNDMAALLARTDAEACFAVDHFVHWAIRHAGSAIAAMGGVDALAFTGGIGENAAPIRDRIAAGLAWASPRPLPVHIVPADEERQIARDAQALLAGAVPPEPSA